MATWQPLVQHKGAGAQQFPTKKAAMTYQFSVFAFTCLYCSQTITLQTNGPRPEQITFQLKLS